MRKTISFIFVFFLLLGIAATVHSTVLYENPLDNTAGPGWQSTSGSQEIAETFALSSMSIITDVTWQGFYYYVDLVDFDAIGTGQTNASFDIRFFTDNGGLPDFNWYYETVSNVTGVSTGLTESTYGNLIYEWSVNLSLGVGIPDTDNYWISIRANSVELDRFGWSLSTSDGSGDVIYFSTIQNTWVSYPQVDLDLQAMKLEGYPVSAVPEPATMLLLGTGLVGVAGAVRRRKKNQA